MNTERNVERSTDRNSSGTLGTNGMKTLCSRYVVLPGENIDTDQIIPARFLKATTRAGLGRHLFADWRRDGEGASRSTPLDAPGAEGARILVAGENFGCGSSREHAAWALRDFGFRAVVSTRIADIFKSNAIKNGIVPVEIDAASYRRLAAHRDGYLTIDVATLIVALPDATQTEFALDPFARHCFLHGVDELGFLLAHDGAIAAYEGGARCAR